MERDSVTQVAHDVVPVSPETDDDSNTTEGQDPVRDRNFAAQFIGIPDLEDGGVWADGARYPVSKRFARATGISDLLGNIVGTMGE